MGKVADNYRYERKFLLSDFTKSDVESIIKLHPAVFSEIYHERLVNNIYFDSIELKNFFDNIDGNSNRIKIRIRWYGNKFGYIEDPKLEIKIKNGVLGRKIVYPLPSFELNKNFNVQMASELICRSNLHETLKEKLKILSPKLLNQYKRKYFQSIDKNYRITIDNDLAVYKIGELHGISTFNYIDNINVILELKYDSMMDSGSQNITNYFLFRLTKSSKYITGIEKILS